MVELSTAEWTADRSVPILELSVGGLLRSTAARAPDAVALVAGVPEVGERRRWTYAQLLEQSERAARALQGRFAPGDRVAVWANNIPEWVILELAAGPGRHHARHRQPSAARRGVDLRPSSVTI
jgi:long-subunit acyl-CoA synthetase (AMP-forming)